MHIKCLTKEWFITGLSRSFLILKVFLYWTHLCSFGSFTTFGVPWTLLVCAFIFDFCLVSKEKISHLKLVSAQDALWELQELANTNFEHSGQTCSLFPFMISNVFQPHLFHNTGFTVVDPLIVGNSFVLLHHPHFCER